jgi:hypothetical protein
MTIDTPQTQEEDSPIAPDINLLWVERTFSGGVADKCRALLASGSMAGRTGSQIIKAAREEDWAERRDEIGVLNDVMIGVE